MDDTGVVRGFESLGDLLRNGERFLEPKGTARDPLREILALDKLHHEDVRCALTVFQSVDRRHVRVIE